MGSNYRTSFSLLFGLFLLSSGLQAASTDSRLVELEASIELLEEANTDLRTELDNRMKISGYADVEYVMTDKKDPGFRMHHLSLFFQKKISEKWRFFSEIEYEDGPKFDNEEGETVVVDTQGGTGSTAVADFGAAEGKIFVEAVNLDYLWRPEAIVRVGRFFTPAGIWSIDHYPPFVVTQERPAHIRKIFPQTVDGAMVYGTVGIGKHYLNYDAYIGNGEGNNGHEDHNENKAMGLKFSAVLAVPGFSHFELGSTLYTDSKDSKNNDSEKTAVGGHAKLVYNEFVLQSEAAYAKYASPTGLTTKGYYAQFSYNPNLWTIGARYDFYDDQNKDKERVTNSIFANYHALNNLVLKVEHHMISKKGSDDSSKTIFSVVSYLE